MVWSRQKKGKNSNPRMINLVLWGSGILVIGVVAGLVLGTADTSTNAQTEEIPVFGYAVANIAKQFACSCGSCGEKNLLICECPTATTTKQFIDTNLMGGMPEEGVVELVKSLYGHFTG